MSQPLMQRVLGADWDKLPAVIRNHYTISIGQKSILEGYMKIAYPDFMLPLVWIIHLFGGLIVRRGDQVFTQVHKTVNDDGDVLHWQRTMNYPDGQKEYFRSYMQILGDKSLTESIGFGFGLQLKMTVENGALVYRSNGHYWQCGKLKIIIPDVLLLGTATITEQAVSDDEFYLDFIIRHPLWGVTYRYHGNFRYV